MEPKGKYEEVTVGTFLVGLTIMAVDVITSILIAPFYAVAWIQDRINPPLPVVKGKMRRPRWIKNG